LLAPDLAGDFFHRAFRQVTEMERPETDPDQPRAARADAGAAVRIAR
jgi:hypothetical protein